MTTAAEFLILPHEHARSDRFRSRLVRALVLVETALRDSRRPYIAFSGGKDSIAVASLVHQIRPEATLHWTDDELEYPEVVAMMSDLQHVAGDQFVTTLGRSQHGGWFVPWMSLPAFRDPLPGAIRKNIPAEFWMAERGFDLAFTGVRAEESAKRRDWLVSQYGGTGHATYMAKTAALPRCCPIWDWSADDVWALIAIWGLPVNPVYLRLDSIGVPRKRQRIGPLPLARRDHLRDGWPDMLARLEKRYGSHWS